MVNGKDIVARLEFLLSHYGISASVFAERIGVQRSSLSHLLSGRNRPSLDFVMRTVEAFPEVDLYWLLYGKGRFPAEEIGSDAKPAYLAGGTKKVERVIVFFEDGTFKAYHE